jgi:hypothetical protein
MRQPGFETTGLEVFDPGHRIGRETLRRASVTPRWEHLAAIKAGDVRPGRVNGTLRGATHASCLEPNGQGVRRLA